SSDLFSAGRDWTNADRELNGFPSRGSGVRIPFPAPYAKPCNTRRSARPAPFPEHPLIGILLIPANPRVRIPPEKPVGEAVRRRPLGLQDHMRVILERRRRVAVPQPALDDVDRRTLVRQVGDRWLTSPCSTPPCSPLLHRAYFASPMHSLVPYVPQGNRNNRH